MKKISFVLCLFWLTSIFQAYGGTIGIIGIRTETKGKQLKIQLIADGLIPDYNSFSLLKPARLVIDFPSLKCKIPRIVSLNNTVYPRLRWAFFKGNLRLVIDSNLKEIPPYQILSKKNILEILLPLEKAVLPIAKIKGIDFEQISPGKCRLVITSDRKVQYEVFHPKRRTMILQLNNVKAPPYLLRELETEHFLCGIKRILPYTIDEKTIAIEVRFKERIPFKIVTTPEHLYLTFKKPLVKEEKIKLVKKEKLPKVKPKKVIEEKKPAVSPFIERKTTTLEIIFPGTVEVFRGEPISMDFQDADLKNVFRILAEVSGFNIVLSDKVQGKVTLKLDNVPWDQVLDLLLQTFNLGVIRRGNILRILPLDELKKEQEKLIQAQRALQKKEESEPLITEEIQVNYVKASDLVKQLKDIKSPRGKVTYDEATNRIIMTDVKSCLEKAKKLVRSLDIAPRQVMIEARIVEVSINYSKELGIQWGGDYLHQSSPTSLIGWRGGAGAGDEFEFENAITGSSWSGDIPLVVNLPPAGTYGGLGVTFARLSRTTTLVLDAKLQAMESEGEGRIISVPKVITMDNQEAVISQGLEIPYRSVSEMGTYTEFREAVLKLTVKPHITPDKKIRMDIEVHKDSAGEILPGMDAIPIEKKEITTTLLIDNNETVVIGGILSEEIHRGEQRVPFFSNIPIFGLLFKNRSETSQKRELLIFITPRVLTPIGV